MSEIRKVMIPALVDTDGHVVAVVRYESGRFATVDDEGHATWDGPEELDEMAREMALHDATGGLDERYEALADMVRRYPAELPPFVPAVGGYTGPLRWVPCSDDDCPECGGNGQVQVLAGSMISWRACGGYV